MADGAAPNASLAERLRRQTEAGPIRFDRWMEQCLYDQAGGFYSRIGEAGRRHGDFVTSPEVGPLFGLVLAQWVEQRWRDAGTPDHFDVVDAGAGRGALTIALRHAVRDTPLAAAARWCTVERSERLREAQTEHLGSDIRRTDVVPDRIAGVVIANELLDNLATRVVQRVQDVPSGWAEIHVGWDESDARFVPVARPLAVRPAGIDRLALAVGGADQLDDLPTGTLLPLPDGAFEWVDTVLGRLDGALLVIDYGVVHAVELVARDGAWLRTYSGHQVGLDPFDSPGQRDITVDVAADLLPSGWNPMRQTDFLASWGIDRFVDEARRHSGSGRFDSLEAIRLHSRLNEAVALCAPEGLGGFLTLEWRVERDQPSESPSPA